MKKNYYFYGIAAALMMGTVALSSCSSDELAVGNETQIAKDVAKTYSFSVQAVMNNEAGTRVFTLGESTITSKFSTEEPIYVFIKNSNGNIAYGNKAINPTNVSNDGQSCTIDVTKTDDFYFIPTSFTPAEGDEIYLYYGMTSDTSNHINGYFDFATDGKKATAEGMDYNLAKTTIESVDNDALTFNDKFSFKNINSIFRQKLTFKEGPNVVNPEIEKIYISSFNGNTVQKYSPFNEDPYDIASIAIINPVLTDGSIYFSMLFYDGSDGGNKDQAITFTANDKDGNTYKCTKAAPTGGFQNNMYYYGEATLEKQGVPTITGANLVANGDKYDITENNFDITISGNSDGYYFRQSASSGTIRLNNLTATYDGNPSFIYFEGEMTTLNLELTGSNSITCSTADACIKGFALKLSCTGSSATLTVMCDDVSYCGILTNDYYDENNNFMNDEEDVSAQLAAEGFTVTRNLDYENENTWIYTVTKNNE